MTVNDQNIYDWSVWEEFCREEGENPRECSEISIELTSERCFTVQYKGDYPKE